MFLVETLPTHIEISLNKASLQCDGGKGSFHCDKTWRIFSCLFIFTYRHENEIASGSNKLDFNKNNNVEKQHLIVFISK